MSFQNGNKINERCEKCDEQATKEWLFEWIPYNQFDNIKEIKKDNVIILKLSTWNNGPLSYNRDERKWIREPNKKITLKCICNSQNNINGFLNEVKSYSTNIYEVEIYSAIWKDGPLRYDYDKKEWIRESEKNVVLKCLYNSQNIIDEFLNEVKTYSTNVYGDDDNILNIYGISHNPETKDYIMVLQDGYSIWKDGPLHYNKNEKKWIRESDKNIALKCLYNSQNNVNKLLSEVKAYFDNNDVVDNNDVEMLTNIDNISDSVNVDDADVDINIDDDDDIYADDDDNINADDDDIDDIGVDDDIDVDDDINIDDDIDVDDDIDIDDNDNNTNSIKIYGISQNPNTKDYIIVLQDVYCKECGEEYADVDDKWCKSCVIRDLRNNFANWTSGNKHIDDLIQEMQLKVDDSYDLLFEWIPYDQFNDIKEIGKGGFATIYSAIWSDGPLYYDIINRRKEWIRDPDKNVALKCLHNSLNISKQFLNEIKAYSIANSSGGNFNDWINRNYKKFDWNEKLSILFDICEATGRRPFFDCAHGDNLVLNICGGIRPEINEPEAPKCYIDLMKKCWDSNPNNRPNADEIQESIYLFENSYNQEFDMRKQQYYEINKQFNEAEKYRKLHFSFEDNRPTHPKAVYTARLLNPYTKKLPKYDDKIYEFSDDMVVELLKDGIITENESDFESTKPNTEPKENPIEFEFSDNIAVEELLLKHVTELE
ncbi:kinase-like domain-containing protein [Rhizophagus irregularis DAOM 181602=DAOM 197198]|nr:kinase-like domain-containing protein [Rhizophagus irregularis DAOM 181602=DAOM 197198]